MIKIENLSKFYGRQQVLKAMHLTLNQGQCIGVIGPNGSGKTTLLKAILGLVLPEEGSIHVDGHNISDGCVYRHEIGYMPQISRFPEHMKVFQLFAMIKKMRPAFSQNQYDEELYQSFEIEKMKNKELGALSGGMRQQVSAALAFLFNPPILILDEPTASLDPVSNELLKNKIKESRKEEKLILITSHMLYDLDEIITHIIYMMNGAPILFEGIEALRAQTSEKKLKKIIVNLINREFAHVKD